MEALVIIALLLIAGAGITRIMAPIVAAAPAIFIIALIILLVAG